MRIALARLVPVAVLAAVLVGCASGSSAYKKGYEFAPAADPCISDGYECRTLTIDGDTRFDIHLIKLN